LRKIIGRGIFYDLFIEPLLAGTKKRISGFISQNDLFPALDICCGTGKQCQLVAKAGKAVIGLDLDLKILKYASSKYPQITFVCADAAHIPFRKDSFKASIISYSLHDKTPEVRTKIIREAKRLLIPEGRIIFLDFENPWNWLSELGSALTWLIERIAGGEHYRNNRQFLKEGGLQTFIKTRGLYPVERLDIPLGNSRIVIAKSEDMF
jgi:ubiquinone/menaquinone biosynthesis C-methylase UbiE